MEDIPKVIEGLLNYEGDIALDEDALDVEWLDHSRLLLKWSKELAHQDKVVAQAKENLEVVTAELSLAIRTDPKKYGLDKVTEGAIRETLITHKLTRAKHKEAQEEYTEALYEQSLLKAAVRSIDRNKDALENLVRLHGMNYFSGPKVPHDLSKDWENRKRSEKANQTVKLKRRSK